ncbi:MAG: Abi family protein [Roseburia sp.]|nr:Abi family protein [Roseburia sp.]
MPQEIKPFRTIEEQMMILKERGLIIDDEEEAKKFLGNLNYYRLSAYTLTLRKNNRFYDNVHFSNVMQIYNFDMELRAALMYLLESIEISMRTYIGYFHGKAYGALGYYEASAFEDKERFKKFTEDYKSAIDEYGDKEIFVHTEGGFTIVKYLFHFDREKRTSRYLGTGAYPLTEQESSYLRILS